MSYRNLSYFFFLLIGFTASAQAPWQGFLPGRTAHYFVQNHVPFNTSLEFGGFSMYSYPLSRLTCQGYFDAVRFDSTSTTGAQVRHYPMRTGSPNVTGLDTSWLGPYVAFQGGLEIYRTNLGGRYVLDSRGRLPGDTAFRYVGPSFQLLGISTGIRADTVLGEADSLLTLRIVHKNTTGTALAWDGKELTLSRLHGWVKTIRMFEPANYNGADTIRVLRYLSGSRELVYPPQSAYRMDLRPGDVLHSVGWLDVEDGWGSCRVWCSQERTAGMTQIVTHSRLISIDTVSGDSLRYTWQDSTQRRCRAYAHSIDTLPPTEVTTQVSIVPIRQALPPNMPNLTGLSNELVPDSSNWGGPFYYSYPLAIIDGRMMRIQNSPYGVLGGRYSGFYEPGIGLRYSYPWSYGGMSCREGYSLVYANLQGRGTGKPILFTGLKSRTPAAHLLTLAPNPASRQVQLALTTARPVQLDMVRPDGTRVLSKVLRSSGLLDIASLPPGLYLWQARQGDHLQTGKLIKE